MSNISIDVTARNCPEKNQQFLTMYGGCPWSLWKVGLFRLS